MGQTCASNQSESALLQEELPTPIDRVSMAEGSIRTVLDDHLNGIHRIATDVFRQQDELKRTNEEMRVSLFNKEEEINGLRQRIGNTAELNHRRCQSHSEDVSSRNKRSDVLKKYETLTGNTRKKAIEAFGKKVNRIELAYRKDLTCRIFVELARLKTGTPKSLRFTVLSRKEDKTHQIAYNVARHAKDTFSKDVLPLFLYFAPSVGLCFHEGKEESILSELKKKQSRLADIKPMLTEQFEVAYASALKEMAVSCDLTKLEKRVENELRDQAWKAKEPWLPNLTDDIIKHLDAYIAECVRVAWRMINQLPPLEIITAEQVSGKQFREYFDIAEEENEENAETHKVCDWPAVTGGGKEDILVKGRALILPKPNPMRVKTV